MPTPGRLIVIEGPAGVGKSTLASGLSLALREMDVTTEIIAFRGGKAGGYIGHERRGRLVHAPGQTPSLPFSNTEEDAITSDVLAHLPVDSWVILDGFWWTNWVDGAMEGNRGKALEGLIAPSRAEWVKVAPSPAFLVRRPTSTPGADRLGKIVDAYDEIALAEQTRHPVAVIDNVGTVEEAVAQMLAVVGGIRFRRAAGRPRSSVRVASRTRRPSVGMLELFPTPGQTALPRPGATPSTPGGGVDLPSTNIPAVFCPMSPARTSPVYETFWRFAAERQSIFFRKIAGEVSLTDDPILAEYKFTNAYRASDRTSQYLIRDVIYAHDRSPVESFFRVMLFKLFNKIETWELLMREVGVPRWEEYDFTRYSAVLESAMQAGRRIYSAAYIMPSGSGDFEDRRKHISHLRLLERMMHDELPQRVAGCRTMRRAFELIRSYPMIGDFLAYQYVTDLNYGEITDFGEMEFVVPGPGAKDGIRKCFTSLGGLTESNLIRWVAERQQGEFERFGIAFRSLWGRPLQLVDCQSLFCEVDKYARQAHPKILGISGRTRIKQSYRPSMTPIVYTYPPKWGINVLVNAVNG